MKILKFGGSSVGTADRIRNVISIIGKYRNEKKRVVVVFSAYQGVTNQLIELGEIAARGDKAYKDLFYDMKTRHLNTAKLLIKGQRIKPANDQIKEWLKNLEEVLFGVYLVKELSAKTLDFIMSFGERLSAFTISQALETAGFANSYLDTRDLIVTDDSFGNARVEFDTTDQKICGYFRTKPPLTIATGFIAATDRGETTTLGRGGSDYTASIFGAALDAQDIEIWTDVDGVLTADPRKVPQAFPVKQMTYLEAMELSHFGAKVIHPPTMQPALDKGITLRIRNTFNPAFQGTTINAVCSSDSCVIRGLSSIDHVALIQIQGSGMIGATGIAERIFKALAEKRINIILITQASSEHSICICVLPDLARKAKSALEKELKYELHYHQINEISIEPDMSIIAVVGENMRKTKGIAGQIFQTLGKNEVNISAISQGSSEVNISMVIARQDEKRALNAIHDSFFLSQKKTIHMYQIGTGLIGAELLRQMAAKSAGLAKNNNIILKLVGLCNQDQMLVNAAGISLENWQKELDKSHVRTNTSAFLETVSGENLPHKVLIDCTADGKIAAQYPALLTAGISVVTPNKIANASDMKTYHSIRNAASSGKSRFYYETNVGAGLPVLGTIRQLCQTGDTVKRIEGVLSGTLSYLFNSFDGGTPFSQLVRQAKEQGFTEPDPRDDLSGLDVARKLLILAREAGATLEMEEIVLEGLLSEKARKAKSVEQFYTILAESDELMEQKRASAALKGKVLRYGAQFAKGKAHIGLMPVGADHPFFALRGSENLIAIYSQNYIQYPLVIKGPGAGAAVTAAGVFSDLLNFTETVTP